jgi:hypothetical protein
MRSMVDLLETACFCRAAGLEVVDPEAMPLRHSDPRPHPIRPLRGAVRILGSGARDNVRRHGLGLREIRLLVLVLVLHPCCFMGQTGSLTVTFHGKKEGQEGEGKGEGGGGGHGILTAIPAVDHPIVPR